jgi:hypothetical protein
MFVAYAYDNTIKIMFFKIEHIIFFSYIVIYKKNVRLVFIQLTRWLHINDQNIVLIHIVRKINQTKKRVQHGKNSRSNRTQHWWLKR